LKKFADDFIVLCGDTIFGGEDIKTWLKEKQYRAFQSRKPQRIWNC